MAKSKKTVVDQLMHLGLERPLAYQAYTAFGFDAPSEIRRNPYQLLLLNERSNWQEIDRLARRLDFDESSEERIAGAIHHSLRSSTLDGHVYLPKDELCRKMGWFLGFFDDDAYESALQDMINRREIFLIEMDDFGNQAIYLHTLYKAESDIAQHLAELSTAGSHITLKTPTPKEMQQVEIELGIRLATAQYEAISASLENKLIIITGGPGTGKTTIIRGVLHLWEQKGTRIMLAAPTGRAAKRLAESTGRRRACTIHRLLEYNPDAQAFGRNAAKKLKADLLVIDEASMIDTELMAALLEALRPSCHLLLVGDVDQLPAVGPGFVLHDLIESGQFKTIRLTDIYRQQEGSLISLNAHKINDGEMPELEGVGVGEGQDFFFIAKPDALRTREAILEMVTDRIPKQFDFDPKIDVQVLCPMIKKDVGVEMMNAVLQEKLNPSASRFKAPFYSLSIGDKIMQTKNDYSKEVFNGDIGFVNRINVSDEMVTIDFEGRDVHYFRQELENTTLAYAVTVHKSQGSEYPAIVMPLVTQHFPMLQRNLLYTAVSRGKQLVVLIGSHRALETAVRNNRIRMRFTGLKRLLQQAFAKTEKKQKKVKITNSSNE